MLSFYLSIYILKQHWKDLPISLIRQFEILSVRIQLTSTVLGLSEFRTLNSLISLYSSMRRFVLSLFCPEFHAFPDEIFLFCPIWLLKIVNLLLISFPYSFSRKVNVLLIKTFAGHNSRGPSQKSLDWILNTFELTTWICVL